MSKETKAVLRAAEREAQVRRQALGTPHLLIGLAADDRSQAASLLEAMGFSPLQVRHEAARKLGSPSRRPARGRSSFSPRAEAVLDRAREAAATDGRRLVEPDDILQAMLADPDGVASRILEKLSTDRMSVPAD
jgi:ATP-dependent Clp protease ATP-binding subunit ClpC